MRHVRTNRTREKKIIINLFTWKVCKVYVILHYFTLWLQVASVAWVVKTANYYHCMFSQPHIYAYLALPKSLLLSDRTSVAAEGVWKNSLLACREASVNIFATSRASCKIFQRYFMKCLHFVSFYLLCKVKAQLSSCCWNKKQQQQTKK